MKYLYIPIWFYSNYIKDNIRFYVLTFTFQSGSIQMIVTLSIPPLKYLYIPIWFYSNKAVRTNKMFFNFFTFQSGSIQIITCYNFSCIHWVFTFQSGSIQIAFRHDQIQPRNCLYIPIWFYSNQDLQSLKV